MRSRGLDQLVATIVDNAAVNETVLPMRDAAVKNPHAAALGHLGGLKGGPARATSLSAERRSEIARKAARARWHGKREAQLDR